MSGIFAIHGSKNDASFLVYHALFALQHRGQYGCGLAVNDHGYIDYKKDLGYVDGVFDLETLSRMRGDIGIGYIDNSQKKTIRFDLDPMVMGSNKGLFAIAYDGSILNREELLAEHSYLKQEMTDSELIGAMIASSETETLEEAIAEVMPFIQGAFSMIVMNEIRLFVYRDPAGIQPLSIGKKEDYYMASSETCAIEALGGDFECEVEPGYLYVLEKDSMKRRKIREALPRKTCMFEMIYYARPDSRIDNMSVYWMRRHLGRLLAKTKPVKADMVIAAPDSGTVAAIGYSDGSGIPYGEGLIKNRYVGRTFIQPDRATREMAIKIKLNVLKENVDGKDIVLVDDSIIRGTTMRSVVKMLKEAGAEKVHVRIASPACRYPCKLGVNLSLNEPLLAEKRSVEEIRTLIQSDSLAFLSAQDILEKTRKGDRFCTGCFTGEYAQVK